MADQYRPGPLTEIHRRRRERPSGRSWASDHSARAWLAEEIARPRLNSAGYAGHKPVLKAAADYLKPNRKAIAGEPTGNRAGRQKRVVEDWREHRVSPRRHRLALNHCWSQRRQRPGRHWSR